MRRIICATLLISLCLQSTGAAAVGPDGANAIATIAQAQFDLHSAADWFTQSPVLAMILTPDRYAAMHAAPPVRVFAPHVDVSKTRLLDVQRPVSRGSGARGTPPELVKRPMLPKDAEKLHPPATSTAASAVLNARTALSLQAPTIDFSLPKPAAKPTIDFSLPKPAATRPPIRQPGGIHPLDVTTSTPNTTGINPWWTYEEGALPGTGKYMVNVGSGNLIVQSDDVDIPERGIDLVFQRTYNSGSLNDTNAASGNDDGSPNENVYGNGWTNTFDTHLAVNSSGGVSVFDIDGARYDYTPNGTGCLAAPAGVHNTLCWDNGCGYFLTKKSGTVYHYWAPSFQSLGSNCVGWGPSSAAYQGRLYMIIARNWNNWIQLTYSWLNGDASTSNNLTQIVAGHQNGQQLTLSFGTVNGRPLLSSITLPNSSQITYSYSGAHDLTSVGKLGNNSANTLADNYGYYAADKLAWTSNPRWNLSGGADGSFTNFYYDGSGRNTGVLLYGFANPTPNDGTGTAIQPGYTTGANTIAYSIFSYPAGGETSLTDVDGHAINWFYDSAARVTQTQEYTGASEGLWLITSTSWDGDNNLTESVDARGYATDYAFDPNGNTVAIALPAVATNQGTFRPTSLYSYDRTNGANNIAAYCDPVRTHALGQDWTSNPGSSDSLCPNSSGATRSTWYDTDGAEPFGRITDTYTPLGRHTAYGYNASIEGGDFGIPTSVTGDCFTQYNSTQNCPQQSFTYDGYGNLSSYNMGNGAWTLEYDTVNRVTSVTDPDGVASRTCYFSDGSVSATQTAAQYAADGNVACGSHSATFTYDADRNKKTEVRQYNNQIGTTTNWYDGADRIVEVALPHDSANDVYSYAWLTRSIYDLSQGGTVSIGSASGLPAHGNLYKIQEWVAVSGGSPAWTDLKGDAYDALDRTVHHYTYQPGTNNLSSSTNSYDQNSATYGLLTNASNQIGAVTTPSYDADGKTIAVNYSGDGGVTPSQTLMFDADGRITSATSSTLGQQTTTYDTDGDITSVQEPSGGGLTSAATLTYSYYPNGQRSALSVASSALTQNNLLQYAYRTDGLRSSLAFTDGGQSASWSWTLSGAGRVQNLSDSSGQGDLTTYDAYGRISGETVPAGGMSNYQYDNEDEVTSLVVPGTTQTNGYDVRGELVSQVFGSDTCGGQGDLTPPLYQNSANGFMVAATNRNCTTGPPAITWDVRNAVGTANASGVTGEGTGYNYDPAGRQNSANQSWSYTHNCGDQQCEVDGNGTLTRSYDAQNHLIGEAVSTWDVQGAALTGCLTGGIAAVPTIETQSFSYGWGPNGHPDLWSGNTLHWDGDAPLFITNGSLLEIKIEGLGFYAPGATHPMQFLDRDQAGYVVGAHWTGGTSAFTPANPYHQVCDNQDLSGYALFEPGPDGIGDGANIIQGVRSFDPALGTWTAPDASAGDARDPMSQKAYMWDLNNAFMYEDPSGYCPAHPAEAGAPAVPIDTSDGTCTLVTVHSCPDPARPPCGDWTPEGQSAVHSANTYITTLNDFVLPLFVPGGAEKEIATELGGEIVARAAASTGRTEARNLAEQLAMQQAKSNPLAGIHLENVVMRDPRWPASQGWIKMSQEINGVIIHYVRNTITHATADFKFM